MAIDPRGDARAMTEHFCAVLSASELDRLQAELANDRAANQRPVPLYNLNKHHRVLAVLDEALKVLTACKKRS
jgi:hypothetical protein